MRERRDANETGHALHEDPVELLRLFFGQAGQALVVSHGINLQFAR
jgi:hypothetical protein